MELERGGGGGGWKPNVDIYPPCPRCGSSNTKFCYYNNYSLTQPRYFCKGCRRYWTKGGSLRNVPVGGGCRKSRRSKSCIRISTTCSRNSPYGGNNNIDATSAATTVPNATNIDLAQVYANFLNQKPHHDHDKDHQNQIPHQILPTDHHPSSFGVHSTNGPVMDHVGFGTNLFQENGVIFECGPLSDKSSETYLSEGNGEYFCGFDSRVHEGVFSESATNQMISYYGLPPLPGEELGWSSSLGFQEGGQNAANEFVLPDTGTFFKP